jgi:glycosyltransferase involved in cell wall biosynthesis
MSMRILQIHNVYRELGGEDAVVRSDREILSGAGHDVRALTGQNPEGRLRAAAALGLSSWNPRAHAHVGRVAAEYHPDIVHVHNVWFELSGAALHGARRGAAPIVMTLHNYRLMCANGMLFRAGHACTDCVGTTALHGLQHRCYRQSFLASAASAASIGLHNAINTWGRCIDHFLALTEFSRSKFVEAGIEPERVSVRRNVAPDPGPRERGPSSSAEVVYVGRVSEDKGIRILLEAWNRARPDGLNLVIVGDGPMRAELSSIDPSRSIRYLGPLPNPEARKLICGARALVFPSLLFENQPMSLLEAMAAGTAIIASDAGGIPETLADGRGGWLTAAGDVDAWASRLAALGDDAAVDGMSSNARGLYEERYSPAAGLRSLLAVYSSLSRGAVP